MIALTKWFAAPCIAVALMFATDAPSAKAQYGYGFHGGGFQLSIGHNPIHRSAHSYHRNSSRWSAHGLRSYRHVPNVRSYRYPNRGHCDWHPTEVVRHGNHYDVIPGHFDYHRGGHHW